MPETLKIVLFLLWCNFLPPLSNFLFGKRFTFPVDANLSWFDNKPLLGPHKTYRGVFFSVAGSVLAFPLLGSEWYVAANAAVLAMTGDLLTSFIKRRLDFKSGASAPVLDQFFEGILPVLFLYESLSLTWWQVITIMFLFVPITYLGSRFWRFLLFRLPMKNYPRSVSSAVRFREWRACHQPHSRLQKWLNFENFFYYRVVMAQFFKMAGLYEKGMRNALDIRIQEVDFIFPQLPQKFDAFRVLFLVDLHLDGMQGLTEAIIKKIEDLEVDLCIIGGDVRMDVYGPVSPAIRKLKKLLRRVKSKHGVIGVLGNHDCIEMVPDLEDAGMMMLVNDSYDLEVNGEKICVVGVDDPHYYKVHDVQKAFKNTTKEDFKVFVAHSPEAYKDAAAHYPDLYLCGHTHGGQIRFPGSGPLFTHSSAPGDTAYGKWVFDGMQGYTSCGVGSSGIPLRFNCPPEITLITLHAEKRVKNKMYSR